MRVPSATNLPDYAPATKTWTYTQPITELSPAEAEADCQALRKAMKGMGTDEKALIQVLCKRSADQNAQLVKAYKGHFGRDLIKDLESETSGDFKKLLTLICLPLPVLDAVCLKEAMKGLGTDEDALIEILVGRSNTEINAIKAAYKQTYSKDLEKEVQSETSGHFRKLLTAVLQANRDETRTNWDVAADVEEFYKAGEKKLGTDESTFISLLVNRPEAHLREVFRAYKEKYAKSMDDVIKKEFSGDLEKALLGIVRSIQNRAPYIASLFEKSMAGLGTKDEKLIRLTIRHRDPRIMAEVKAAYQQQFGKSLYKRVEGETSGDYRKGLLACIGE